MQQNIYENLCLEFELPEGMARGFVPDGNGTDTLFLIKKNGVIYAYQDLCPHYGKTTLPWRNDAYLNGTKDKIVCFTHGAQFDIKSGECLSGPCLGQSLNQLDVEVSANGSVTVSGCLREVSHSKN